MSFFKVGYIIEFCLFVLLVWAWCRPRLHKPLPPGPKAIPFVGNLRDFTLKQLWLRATQWADTFGEYFNIDDVAAQYSISQQGTYAICTSLVKGWCS